MYHVTLASTRLQLFHWKTPSSRNSSNVPSPFPSWITSTPSFQLFLGPPRYLVPSRLQFRLFLFNSFLFTSFLNFKVNVLVFSTVCFLRDVIPTTCSVSTFVIISYSFIKYCGGRLSHNTRGRVHSLARWSVHNSLSAAGNGKCRCHEWFMKHNYEVRLLSGETDVFLLTAYQVSRKRRKEQFHHTFSLTLFLTTEQVSLSAVQL